MDDFLGVLRLPTPLPLLALTVFALSGCLETETETTPDPVDEERQAIGGSVHDIDDYCATLRRSRRSPGRRGPTSEQHRAAERAVGRLLRIVHRYDDSDYATQHEHREGLAGVARDMEQADCLSGHVARIDRFLRELTLPEPEVEEEYVEEP